MPDAPARVLIVDDTPANLSFLTDALAAAGYDVRVALSGHTALEQLRYELPAVILLDAVMPELDGFATCARLKADARTRDIPVIFMTALTDTADIVRAFRQGAVDYLTKPVREAELLARLATHVEHARDLRRAHATVDAWPRPSLTVSGGGVVTSLSRRAEALLPGLALDTPLPADLAAWVAEQADGRATTPCAVFTLAGQAVQAEFCGRLDTDEFLLLVGVAPNAGAGALALAHDLTPREREVLEWVAAGKTNRDIAAILDISPRTVTKHLERVFVKLGVETRTAAANRVLAAQRGE